MKNSRGICTLAIYTGAQVMSLLIPKMEKDREALRHFEKLMSVTE